MGPPTWLFEKLPGATFEPSLFKGAELNIDIGFVVHDYINDGKDFLNEGLFFDAKISFDNALSRKPASSNRLTNSENTVSLVIPTRYSG
jgi:hypothetical protein